MFQDIETLEEDIAQLEGFRNFLLFTKESRRLDPSTHPMHSAKNIPQLTNAESAFQVLQPPCCMLIPRARLMALCYEKLGCVTELDFTDRELTSSHARFLAGFLPFLRELRSLSLLGVTLGREGVMALAASVKQCPKFQCLDLTQEKYKFIVKHSDVLKRIASNGVDVSWWGKIVQDVKDVLPSSVTVRV
jgi:hypothetical protein